MYGCESWTIKKAECQWIDAFEVWCWRRLLRIPWTARRSNQSILKEISPECSLEGLRLKLKLQYSGHWMWRADSFEKILMLEKIEGRRRGGQRMRWLDGITTQWTWVWVNSGKLGELQSMGLQRVRHDWATELNWTDWIIEKAREFQKNSYFCFIDYIKDFDCVDWNKLWKILKEFKTCLLTNLYGQEICRSRSNS